MKPRTKWTWVGALAAVAVACGGTTATPPSPSGSAGSAGGPSSAGALSMAGAGLTSSAGSGGGGGGAQPVAVGGEAGGSDQPLGGEAGAAGAAGAPPSLDCTAALAEVQVHTSGFGEPLGYPLYALDGCRLVYVASGAKPGALLLRDLATGVETELDAAEHRPRRPSVAGSVIAWESDGESGSQVQVVDTGGAAPFSITFDAAAEPRATEDAVVFTAFVGEQPNGDTDVQLFDLTTRKLVTVAGGAAQQRFADVSATHVAVTDFSESPKGYFDEIDAISDIVIVDRATLEPTRREASGKQAFPLLGDSGLLAYLEWGAVHPEPKFGEFLLKVGRIDEPVSADLNIKGGTEKVRTDPAYVRPSLHGSYLDYVDLAATPGSTSTSPQLFRADLTATALPVAVAVPGSGRLLGPIAQSSLTLVARPAQGATTLELVAVAR